MRTLNLGTLAHVDAGKTSLTERLHYAAGIIDDITVNLIDAPGHPDFIAEVERVLSVLSAVEGVLVCACDRHQPVFNPAPAGPHNPLNRQEYLLHVMRRV